MKTLLVLNIIVGTVCYCEGAALLYVVNRSIYQSNVDGMQEITLVERNLGELGGIAVNPRTGILFYADLTNNYILETPITNIKPLYIGQIKADSISVDYICNHIYYTNVYAHKNSIEVFGATSSVVVYKDSTQVPTSIAVSPKEGCMFWIENEIHRIQKGAMDGTTLKVTIVEFVGTSLGLTVDESTNRVFWTLTEAGSISYCDYFGKNRKDILFMGIRERQPTRIAVLESYMYFTTINGMYKADSVIGRNRETLKFQHSFYKIYGDITVYSPIESNNNITCIDGVGCLCVLPPRTYRTTTVPGCLCDKTNEKRSSCTYPDEETTGNASLVYIENKGVYQLTIDGKTKTKLSNWSSTLWDSGGLDIHPITGILFISEFNSSEIRKAPIDKLNTLTGFLPKKRAQSIAVDWIYNHIYYTNEYNKEDKTIEVSDYTNKTPVVIVLYKKLNSPEYLAISPNDGYLFWIETDSTKQILRSSMAGVVKPLAIVTKDFTRMPTGLALDLVHQRIYWTVGNRIERCDYNGNGRTLILTLTDSNFRVAIHQNWLYTTTHSQIVRANKFDGKEFKVIAKRDFTFQNTFGDLKVYAPLKSLSTRSYCRDGPECLCLPSARQNASYQGIACRCAVPNIKSTCTFARNQNEVTTQAGEATVTVATEEEKTTENPDSALAGMIPEEIDNVKGNRLEFCFWRK